MNIKSLSPYSIIVTILLISSTVVAQDNKELSAEEMQSLMNTDRIPIRNVTETKGSPYLFDNFHEGSIQLANGKTTNVLPIRFNAYEQNLEFREGNSAFVMDSNTVTEFELYTDSSIYKFKKGFNSRRLSEDEFVRVIIDDEVQFMAKHSVSFQQGVATYGTATKKDEYNSNVTYYIKVGDGNTKRIRSLSKKRVLQNISTHKKEIESFTDTNNIDFSDSKDVEKLLLYYNSLLNETS